MKLRWNVNVNSESLFIIHILLTLKLWINEDKNSVLRSNMLFMNEISFWERTNGMNVQNIKAVGYELRWHGKNKSKFPNSGTLELYKLSWFWNKEKCPSKDATWVMSIVWTIASFFYVGAVENLRALKAETGYLLSSTTTPKKWKSTSRRTASASYTTVCWRISIIH